MDSYSFGAGNLRSLRCAVCRQKIRHTDISYVSLRRSSADVSDVPLDIKVKVNLVLYLIDILSLIVYLIFLV